MDNRPEAAEMSGKNVMEKIGDILLEDENFDGIVKVQDREFMVHMNVLEEYPMLHSTLKHEVVGEKICVVVLPDCKPEIFQDIRNFLYFGELDNMNANSVIDLYTAAAKYGIDRLKTSCTEFMKQELSVETICAFVDLAVHHSDLVLLEAGKEFFTENIKTITPTVKWQSFMALNPATAFDMIVKARYSRSGQGHG